MLQTGFARRSLWAREDCENRVESTFARRRKGETFTTIRSIGLATGGGDCPGINAVIRAVVKTAILRHGWRVVGIQNCFDGLIWPERCMELTVDSVRGLLPLGGTILGTTNHGNPFCYPLEENGQKVTRDLSALCLEHLSTMGLDAIVVVGGEGTLGIAQDFARRGMPLVAIPKTIDHDLSITETTLGFFTASTTSVASIRASNPIRPVSRKRSSLRALPRK